MLFDQGVISASMPPWHHFIDLAVISRDSYGQRGLCLSCYTL